MARTEGTSEYDPKFIDEVDAYLEECKDDNKQLVKQENKEKGYVMYENRLVVSLPSIVGFAKRIGVSRKTLYNWRDENDDFADALDKILAEQQERLMNNGLSGEYNPTIAKLILSSNHGMREGIDATSKGKQLNTFTNEQIDRIAKRIYERNSTDDETSE